MKRTMILWVTAALALTPAVYAQDASSDFGSSDASTDAAAAPSWGQFKWSGDQEFAWRQAVDEAAENDGASVEGKLSGEYKFGDFKAVAAAQVRNNEFVPGETALYYAPGQFKFGLGLQEFSWGVADKKNPTDTLNARDFRYDVDAPRLVNPAASVSWYPADWVSVDVVYEPWKKQSQFPVNFGTTTQAGLDTTKSTAVSLVTAKLGSAYGSALSAAYNPTVTVQDQSEYTYDKPVYGARANFFLPGVDLGLSYVYDWDSYYTPVITMGSYLAGGIYLPSNIELTIKRIHRIGLNAKTTIDKYGLWLETAYNITEDPMGTDYAIRNSKVSWTAGFDFNFGPGSVYYMNFQYAGEWVPGYDYGTLTLDTTRTGDKAYMTEYAYKSTVQALGFETEALMNTFTTNLKFPLNDSTVTPQLTTAVIVPVGYDDSKATRYVSADFKPEVDVMPADGLHFLVGADLTYAWIKKAGSNDITLDKTTDKLGAYTPDNNVYVKVQYKWNGSLGN